MWKIQWSLSILISFLWHIDRRSNKWQTLIYLVCIISQNMHNTVNLIFRDVESSIISVCVVWTVIWFDRYWHQSAEKLYFKLSNNNFYRWRDQILQLFLQVLILNKSNVIKYHRTAFLMKGCWVAPYLSLDIQTVHSGLGGYPHPAELLLNHSQSFPNIRRHSLVLLSLLSSPDNHSYYSSTPSFLLRFQLFYSVQFSFI